MHHPGSLLEPAQICERRSTVARVGLAHAMAIDSTGHTCQRSWALASAARSSFQPMHRRAGTWDLP